MSLRSQDIFCPHKDLFYCIYFDDAQISAKVPLVHNVFAFLNNDDRRSYFLLN